MKIHITVFILFISLAGVAQQPLSLSEAIRYSLERNYDILIEQNRVETAVNNNNWGEAGRWPSLNLNVNQNNGITDNVKTASPFQLQDITISNSLSPGISLNWTLFNGFKVNMSKKRLEELQRESDGNADIVVSNTIQAVILGYYRVVLEEQRLSEFERQLELSRDRYSYLKVKNELGGAGTSEMFLEEMNYLNDSTNLISQKLVYRKAVRDLNFLMGEENPDRRYSLTDALEVDEVAYDLDDLYQKMTSRNVDLRKQYITQSIRGYELEMARADRMPVVTFSPGYSHTNSRVDLSNASFPTGDGGFVGGPSEPLTAITDNYSANFRLTFTLFNGGRINRAIQNAMIQEDIARISTDKMTYRLYRDLTHAVDQHDIRSQIRAINERKLDVARKNLEIASEQYRNGTINSFDYRTVQNDQLSAAIQHLNSLYNLIDSHVGILRLTGGIVETYDN